MCFTIVKRGRGKVLQHLGHDYYFHKRYSKKITYWRCSKYKKLKCGGSITVFMAVLVLSSHYLTAKLNEVWIEAKAEIPELIPDDDDIFEEFLHIGKGWGKEIKRQQEDVLERNRKMENEEECSLYAFIGRVRLNIALDALKDVRSMAQSADRSSFAHTLLYDAVRAYHRRSILTKKLEAPILRTYGPTLDADNLTGQYIKVFSILPKHKPKPREVMPYS